MLTCHVTDEEWGTKCWCQPRCYQVCPMCAGRSASCHYCEGTGMIDAVDPSDEEVTLLVVHNDIEEIIAESGL